MQGLQPRASADRCPGLLRPHAAEDGLVVRLRLPGGQTTSATLLQLSRVAGQFGEGSLQLTSRGNVQLRGLDETRLPELVDRVSELGLLPSASHERVRNIVASPLAGLDPCQADLRPMVVALDQALCATPELAELPGRFLFALDGGGGELLSLRFDLGYLARDSEAGVVLVGGRSHGIATSAAAAVDLLVQLSMAFVRLRRRLVPRPWHVSELADPAELHGRLRAVAVHSPAAPVPLGAVQGAASVGVPLALLTPLQLAAIDEAAAGGLVVVTPWRGVLIPRAATALPRLAAVGLVTEPASVWSALTACVGAPGCAKSRISTRHIATGLAAALDHAPVPPIHVSGCERRCGAPAGSHLDLVAPETLQAALARVAQ